MLLVSVAPSWGQYPYRPYGGSRYPQMPPWQQRYQPPGYGGYQPPGYGGYQPPGQGPGAQDDGRHLWVYGSRGEGSFRDMGDGNWVESNQTGEFHFREVARTPQFVELFDPDRSASVRLTNRVMYNHGPGDPVWHRGYIGQWEQ
jgi:hypothetical protein